MKKKVLMKRILTALAMAAMIPAGETWAADNIRIDSGTDEITHEGNFNKDLSGMDAVVVDNTASNSSITITGSLNTTVSGGNGIRANASFDEGTNKISVGTLDQNTPINITLTGGQVEYTETRTDDNNVEYFKVYTKYNPAAVYAGNDSTTGAIKFKATWDRTLTLGAEALGKGKVDLNGDATIQIGNDNYGLYAGKNGQINVNKNLTLTATGDNAVGIAAENSTLIYKGKVDKVTGPAGVIGYGKDLPISSDESENTYGSSVILNGDANVINVGRNNKAIYAEGVDAKGNSNTVESGDKGIGSFAITGNVEAENGGNITLDARNAESVNRLKGDLTADGVGSFMSLGMR